MLLLLLLTTHRSTKPPEATNTFGLYICILEGGGGVKYSGSACKMGQVQLFCIL